MSAFSICGPGDRENGPISAIRLPKCQKRCPEPFLDNTPFAPGRKTKAKMRLRAQKCVFGGQNGMLGPKWPKGAFWESKITFWVPFRSLAQRAYETKGFVAPFSHFWRQNPKMDSFFHFWATKCKKGVILHFWSQKRQNELI